MIIRAIAIPAAYIYSFFININNDVVPAVMPQSKIKKEYIYIGVAIALIIIMNNK